MAWIESHQTVWGHPKTRRAARRLGIADVQLVGHLHALWHWALDHAESGDLSRYDAEDIAIAARWDGEAGEFVQALAECGPGGGPGFLDRDGDTLGLHNWGRYTERLVARRDSSRKANHDRWHAARGVRADGCEWCEESPKESPPTPDPTPPDTDDPPTGVRPESDRSADGDDPESTRPDPTGPDRTKSERHKRRAPETPLPDGWQPTDAHRQLAAEQAVDCDHEAAKFRDHAAANDRRQRDWDAAFRTWLRRARDYAATNGQARASPNGKQHQFATTRRF